MNNKPLVDLTEREIQILAWVKGGLKHKEIAHHLGFRKEQSVKNVICKLRKKFSVTDAVSTKDLLAQ